MSKFALTMFVITAVGTLAHAQDQGEMFMTSAGFLAISTPVGFKQADGPMEILFTPGGKPFGKTESFIYVATVRVGKDTQYPDLSAFIDFDVKSFRDRFPTGGTNRETPIELKHSRTQVPAWTFRSGEKKNAFERLVFLQDVNHLVWLLVLSANTEKEFNQHLSAFERFVQSYKGSILVGQPK